MARANCHGSPESCREWDGSPTLKRTETDINNRLRKAFPPLACWDRRPILSMGVKLWCTSMSHDYKKNKEERREISTESQVRMTVTLLTVLVSVLALWQYNDGLPSRVLALRSTEGFLNPSMWESSESNQQLWSCQSCWSSFQICSDWWWSYPMQLIKVDIFELHKKKGSLLH